jgi:hypothetical protein
MLSTAIKQVQKILMILLSLRLISLTCFPDHNLSGFIIDGGNRQNDLVKLGRAENRSL